MSNITRDKSTGLERLQIRTDFGNADVFLHGAHVSHFQPADCAQPVLWMSKSSNFLPAKAIRGGVPICFPWFGPKADDPKAAQHGFARLSAFEREKVEPGADDSVTVTLGMTSTDKTRALWPHSFHAQHIITVGKTLKMEFRVTNRDTSPFKFEAALHTYYLVGDVAKIQIAGLAGATYADRLNPGNHFVEHDSLIEFTGEFDRTFFNTEAPVTIFDPVLKRSMINKKSGSRSTVVWNPWSAKAKLMSDFDDDGWKNMVCVETANAGENAIELQPGESHSMIAEISVENNQ